MSEAPPYWQLIAVLFSNQPLSPALAMTLHEAALALYREGGGARDILGDLVHGQVRNLRKDLLLGTIGGPAFEATVETERGTASVRFLLTRTGLELMGAASGRDTAVGPQQPHRLLN